MTVSQLEFDKKQLDNAGSVQVAVIVVPSPAAGTYLSRRGRSITMDRSSNPPASAIPVNSVNEPTLPLLATMT